MGAGDAAVDPRSVLARAEYARRGARGGVVALITDEPVRAQAVSRLTRDLDQAVTPFHQAGLPDDWRYLFLDGVSVRVRRTGGRKRVQRLVVYGVRAEGTRQLQRIVTDGCTGWAAALQTVYPRVPPQRCWVLSSAIW